MDSSSQLNVTERGISKPANNVDTDPSNKRMKTIPTDPNPNNNKLDVFRIPHSRMRELVHWPLTEAASVPDVQDLQPSLQAVYEAMWELKSHEIIENEYIMDTLKARLQARQVNEAPKLWNILQKVYSEITLVESNKYIRPIN